MPRISSFHGISVYMYFGDHGPPHFHARYSGRRGRFTLDGAFVGGDLPPRARRLVRKWVQLHPKELESCWARAYHCTVAIERQPDGRCDSRRSPRGPNRSLWFSDGSERIVGLTRFLRGPVFEEIARDDDAFRQVRADPEAGTIVWPNGADLDPDVLHGDYEPPFMDQGD